MIIPSPNGKRGSSMRIITYLGSGNSRHVYRIGKYVIKIPINDKGESDNIYEHHYWRKLRKNNLKYSKCFAPCRLLPNNWLMMKYIKPTNESWNNLPSWALNIDCCQVGYDNNKNLMAYDYAF